MSNNITEQRVYVEVNEPSRTDVEITELRNAVEVNEDVTQAYVTLTGQQGARGPGIVYGNGNPGPEDGIVGDTYINLDNNTLWGPKTESGWPAEPFFVPGAALRHVHTQESASDTWTIDHTLGGRPSVTVVDSAATVVIGEVSYISNTRVVVSFTAPFSGYAYLT